MNERIWELELQSYVTLTKAGLDGRNEKTTTIFDREKFAELIVKECIDLASKEQKRYASITHRNMSECAVALGNFSLLMKDHFEDEE